MIGCDCPTRLGALGLTDENEARRLIERMPQDRRELVEAIARSHALWTYAGSLAARAKATADRAAAIGDAKIIAAANQAVRSANAALVQLGLFTNEVQKAALAAVRAGDIGEEDVPIFMRTVGYTPRPNVDYPIVAEDDELTYYRKEAGLAAAPALLILAIGAALAILGFAVITSLGLYHRLSKEAITKARIEWENAQKALQERDQLPLDQRPPLPPPTGGGSLFDAGALMPLVLLGVAVLALGGLSRPTRS